MTTVGDELRSAKAISFEAANPLFQVVAKAYASSRCVLYRTPTSASLMGDVWGRLASLAGFSFKEEDESTGAAYQKVAAYGRTVFKVLLAVFGVGLILLLLMPRQVAEVSDPGFVLPASWILLTGVLPLGLVFGGVSNWFQAVDRLKGANTVASEDRDKCLRWLTINEIVRVSAELFISAMISLLICTTLGFPMNSVFVLCFALLNLATMGLKVISESSTGKVPLTDEQSNKSPEKMNEADSQQERSSSPFATFSLWDSSLFTNVLLLLAFRVVIGLMVDLNTGVFSTPLAISHGFRDSVSQFLDLPIVKEEKKLVFDFVRSEIQSKLLIWLIMLSFYFPKYIRHLVISVRYSKTWRQYWDVIVLHVFLLLGVIGWFALKSLANPMLVKGTNRKVLAHQAYYVALFCLFGEQMVKQVMRRNYKQKPSLIPVNFFILFSFVISVDHDKDLQKSFEKHMFGLPWFVAVTAVPVMNFFQLNMQAYRELSLVFGEAEEQPEAESEKETKTKTKKKKNK